MILWVKDKLSAIVSLKYSEFPHLQPDAISSISSRVEENEGKREMAMIAAN